MVLNRLLRAGESKMLKRLDKIAEHIDSLEEDLLDLSDAELRAKTDDFKQRYESGEADLDDLLPEAFSVVREAAKRTLGQRHYKVQLMGGAALHLGQVAEMRTGEGKTLTCVLPAYLNAIAGEGVHVVTTNDYLAKRDAEWMGRVHRFLGLTVGVILNDMTPAQRREAYTMDITYGTNNEFGFDYLRDNMAWALDDCVQRGHHYAIVDEVDSILIDEARTPLIISGPADEQSSRWYTEFARLAPMMRGIDTTAMKPEERRAKAATIERDYHYEVDIRKRTVNVTDNGVRFVEDQLGISNLYEAANSPLVGFLNNAIKVEALFTRDKDYIVRDGEVMIVDEFTGRVLSGRRYNEGMHQSIEAKEGVEIKAENQTLATITLQNYFRLYDKLAGMTGTAQTEAAELHQTYKLGVVTIPTNRAMVRQDRSDLIYKSEQAKLAAVVEDIAERNERGQPVLVGTATVEHSEHLSKLLVSEGIPHQVLNAKQHEKEALIVAMAGRSGAVTVSTNMAGRGTDIVLGGNPEPVAQYQLDQELKARGLNSEVSPDEYNEAFDAEWPAMLEAVKADLDADKDGAAVREAGGLYVLGTERHESRRIDNQLRGRAGRQGDPGESRFYLSLEDDLMRRFNASMVETVMNRLRVPDDVPIEHKMVTKAILSAQTQIEQQNFEIRKDVLKYDEVMNEQRKVVYAERRRMLEGEDLHEQVQRMITDVITAYTTGATADGYVEDWDLDQLWTALKTLYPVKLDWHALVEKDEDSGDDLSREELEEAVLEDARSCYANREAEIDAVAGEGQMRDLERRVMLTVLDRKWREHLYEMDYLKTGIGLRAMAQRDPLIEYQREGFDMFRAMLDGLKEESVGFLFNLEIKVGPPAPTETVQPAAGEIPGTPAGPNGQPANGQPANGRPANGQQPNGQAARPARRAPAPPPPPPAPETQVPAALRGKGLGASGGPQRLSYSGPAESGGVEKKSEQSDADGAGGTRRERREQARAKAKTGRKGSSRH